MNETARILCAIGNTRRTPTFDGFLNALNGDKPDSRDEWRVLFLTLESLEAQELVTIERVRGRIDTLILTDLGAERAREAQEQMR